MFAQHAGVGPKLFNEERPAVQINWSILVETKCVLLQTWEIRLYKRQTELFGLRRPCDPEAEVSPPFHEYGDLFLWFQKERTVVVGGVTPHMASPDLLANTGRRPEFREHH